MTPAEFADQALDLLTEITEMTPIAEKEHLTLNDLPLVTDMLASFNRRAVTLLSNIETTMPHLNEPSMSLEQAQAAAAAKPYPKITKESIESQIRMVEHYFPSIVNPQFCICLIHMLNGFTFVGKSAPASAGNFDPAIGERYAYEDAFRQIWSHEAYLLRQSLSEGRA